MVPADQPTAARPALVPLAGRQRELAVIRRIVERKGGGAHIVLLEGAPGVGKTSVIQHLAREAAAANRTRFLFAQCYGEVSTQSAFHPFLELLSQISEKRNASSGWARIWKFLGETAPDWLELIPAVGPAIGASVKSIHVASEMLTDAKARSAELERQFVAAIERFSAEQALPAIVIEDTHLIDRASCSLLNRLASLQDVSVCVVLTYRPTDIPDEHPLRRLTLEWLSRQRATRVTLLDLEESDIAEYLRVRYGQLPHQRLPRWLSQLCSGNPLYTAQYLNLLEEAGVLLKSADGFALQGDFREVQGNLVATGRLAELEAPASVEALLDERIQRLVESERELLQLGSVQGERFFSLVLSKLLKRPELDVLAELRRVAERHRLIRTHAANDWYTDKSEAYVFEHLLMQRAFYQRLSPRERVLYHCDVADVLKSAFPERGRHHRQVTIEIAYHLACGNQPLDAARGYYEAARSSFDDGAFGEVEHLCESGLKQLLRIEQPSDVASRLFADSVLLMLTSGSRQSDDEEANRRYLALARTARAAALQIGRSELAAKLVALEGSLLVPLGRTQDGIRVLREAVELAEASGGTLTRFFTLLKLGNNLAKENVPESLVVRQRALALFEQSLAGQDDPALRRLYAELLVSLGFGYLDAEDLGTAGTFLQRGIEAVRRSGRNDNLLHSLNYAGQYYVAVGMLGDALAALSQSDADDALKASNSAWYAYNLGLLGKVRLEQGNLDGAASDLRRALELSEAANSVDLVTLVRVYVAELLMQPSFAGRDLVACERLLAKNLEEATAAGLVRSQVLSMGALADLRALQAQDAAALTYSAEAVAAVDAHGPLPAVRTEEVLFRHYTLLTKRGDSHAATFARRAYEVMRAKATTIQNERVKESFLIRVPLNLAIAEAWVGLADNRSKEPDVEASAPVSQVEDPAAS